MTCFDGRKWTERKIAFWSLCFSILSIFISCGSTIYFENKSNRFAQKSFCIDKVSIRLDELNSSLYELPKLISGCGVAAKLYCNDARSKVAKSRNLSFQIGGMLSEKSSSRSSIDNITNLLNQAEKELKITNGNQGSILIASAHKISLVRQEISNIGIQSLECSDFSE